MVSGLVDRGKVPAHVFPGRPSQVTEDKVAAIIAGVRRGMRPYGAAGLAGVYKQTFHYWLRRGEQLDLDDIDPSRLSRSEQLYVVLARGVLIAQGEFELRQVTRIDRAAEDDWKAALVLLERLFEEWRPVRKGRIEVTYSAPIVEPAETPVSTPKEQWAAIRELARQGTRELPAPPKRCAHGLSECPTCDGSEAPTPVVARGCDAGDHQLNGNRMQCVRCGTAWSRPR